MSTTVTPKPGKQLWGIYHTDREHARELGDPLRTTIEAPTKIAAEEAAAKLGFGRAILPESARGEAGGDSGLSLNTVGGLTSLVAEIAARGSPRGNRDNPPAEKNATPARFRRQDG